MFYLHELSPLYEAVQGSGLFPDSKFFTDCRAKSTPDKIVEAYLAAKETPGFDLKSFVSTHFEYPETPESGYQTQGKPLREHLDALWDTLSRQPEPDSASTLLPLPYPYVVPGGRFREIYYWDSYFTMLGLQVSGRKDLIRHMVDNFAHLIQQYGHIPNGNRSYYLSRSQPPFFALMVNLLAEMDGEAETLSHYRKMLEMEYDFWMDGEKSFPESAGTESHRRLVRLSDGSLLNRYWDDDPSPRPEAYAEDLHTAAESGRPAAEVYRHLRAAAESGWDFSSRWLADPAQLSSIRTCDLIPIDLNCLLYGLEKTLVHAYRLLPDHTPVEVYKDRAHARKEAILRHCWDSERGFFFDADLESGRTAGPMTLAGVFPLFFGIAEPEQAARVAENIERHFLCSGGLVTTLAQTGQQWDAPNGWAPLQGIAYKGLQDYGFEELAEKIRCNWMQVCEKTYAETGKMMEKYNVQSPDAPGGGGEYPNQDGFGWTNGVYLKMSES